MYQGTESMYTEEAVQQYLPHLTYVSSHHFDVCSTDNCFDFTHERQLIYNPFCILNVKVKFHGLIVFPLDANETVTCYSGLIITDEQDRVVFSFEEPQQCRLHHSCETVTTNVQMTDSSETCK